MYNKILSSHSNKTVKYFHWLILLVVSLFIAHLIVIESQKKPVLVLIHQSNYQLAMAFSWPFTFLLMFWIHCCIKKLDVRFPWTSNWLERLLLQFILCVVFVLVVDVWVIKGYFSWFDNDFEESGYMEIEFPIVRWMVLFMNVFYIAWFFAQNYFHTKKVNEDFKDFIIFLRDKEEQKRFYDQKIRAHLGDKVLMVGLDEIACFEREDYVGYVYLLDGRRFNMDLKINELNNLLDGTSFYQISRSVIVSLAIVEGYNKVKNLQGELNLKNGLKVGASLLVSRDRMEGFKKHFALFEVL